MDLLQRLTAPCFDCAAVATYLDTLTEPARRAAMAALPRCAQARLYDAFQGFRRLRPSAVVGAHLPPFAPVVHWGINNLPAARCFAKVMYRAPDGDIGGYNRQRWAWLTGPGYFTVTDGEQGDLCIDYTKLPEATPPGWPRLTDNGRGLSYFVYRGLRDTLRAVSEHVSIGRASRDGVWLENYFILVREEAASAVSLQLVS